MYEGVLYRLDEDLLSFEEVLYLLIGVAELDVLPEEEVAATRPFEVEVVRERL